MTEAQFRERLKALGLTLDDQAIAAAFKGAQHLRTQVTQIEAYLATKK